MMRRMTAIILALLMMLAPGLAHMENWDDEPLFLGLHFGMRLKETKARLEEAFGVAFEESYGKISSQLESREAVLYGYPVIIRVYFDKDGYQMEEVGVIFHHEASLGYITEGEAVTQERFCEIIDAAVDELSVLHAYFEASYGMPTGGSLRVRKEDPSFFKYSYPNQEGRLDFEAVKKVAQDGNTFFLSTLWNDIDLTLSVYAEKPADAKGVYTISTRADVRRILIINGRRYEPLVGFEGEDGPYPLEEATPQ